MQYYYLKALKMSIKDHLVTKLESQIELWNKQLDSLTADAETEKADADNQKASAELKLDLASNLEQLKNNINQANKSLLELKEAGEQKLSELKSNIDKWLS
jgi:hypothetical protein